MLEFQRRVIKEKAELDDKIAPLNNFIGNSPLFGVLDTEEQERLKVQLDIMYQYSEVLGQRIEVYSEPVERL